jgi:ribosomal protein S27E
LTGGRISAPPPAYRRIVVAPPFGAAQVCAYPPNGATLDKTVPVNSAYPEKLILFLFFNFIEVAMISCYKNTLCNGSGGKGKTITKGRIIDSFNPPRFTDKGCGNSINYCNGGNDQLVKKIISNFGVYNAYPVIINNRAAEPRGMLFS